MSTHESSSAAYPEVTFHHAPTDSDSMVKKIIRYYRDPFGDYAD
jgi:hypothetical protein